MDVLIILYYISKLLLYLLIYSSTSLLGFYPDLLSLFIVFYCMCDPGKFYLFSVIAGSLFYYNQIAGHDLFYSCVRVAGSVILGNSAFYTGLYMEHTVLQSGLIFLHETGVMKILKSAIVYREQTGHFYLVDPKVYLRASEKYTIFSKVEVISVETCYDMCVKGQLKDLLSEKRYPHS